MSAPTAAIFLTGKRNAIGEMVLLGRENGAKTLYVPAGQRAAIVALPAGLVEGLDICYFTSPAELVDEVIGIASFSTHMIDSLAIAG